MPAWNVHGDKIVADNMEFKDGHLLFWRQEPQTANERAISRITGSEPPIYLVRVFAPGAWWSVEVLEGA